MVARRRLWSALALMSIIAIAAALRFYRLDTLPPGFYHDEAYYGLDALSLVRGKTFPRFYEGWELYAADAHADRPARPTRFPVFFEGNYGREPLHVYLASLSIRLFGNTALAVRAVSALSGTVAVAAVWFAARSMFPATQDSVFHGELLPLLAAFSLAVLYPALHFSRFGIRAMTMLPVLTLSVAAFWRGWHARSEPWLIVAGSLTGLGLYTFAAARLFPLVYLVFGFYLVFLDRSGLRELWRGLLLAISAALLTAAPLLIYFARYPYFFYFLIAYVATNGEGIAAGSPGITLLRNAGRVVAGFFWRGETHLRHNLPGRPYLDPVQAILWGVGLVRSLRFVLRQEYAFLLIWFGVMLLPSMLSGDAPHFGRLIGAAPPAALLIAHGGAYLAVLIERAASRRLAILAVATIGLTSLVLTARDYFGRFATHPDLARDFYLADWQLGQYAAALPPDTVLYLTPSQEEMATIYYAIGDPEGLRSFNGGEGLIPAGISGRPVTYFVRPSEGVTLDNLMAYFPEGSLGASGDGFIPFHVPSDAERNRAEAVNAADFANVVELIGHEIMQSEDHVIVTLVWRAATVPALDYTAFVHLIDSDDRLVAQTDRPPAGYPTSDWGAGEVIVDHFRIDLEPDTGPGTYRLMTGFYDPATVERLGDAVPVGEITIQ